MNLFKKPKLKNHTIIIGCGDLGAAIANQLSSSNEPVLVIDLNKNTFNKLERGYKGTTLTGNASEFNTLEAATINTAKTVILVTNNDNTNILIAQLAKKVYGVPQVITRLYDAGRECVYKDFGIETISPTVLSSNELYNILGGLS